MKRGTAGIVGMLLGAFAAGCGEPPQGRTGKAPADATCPFTPSNSLARQALSCPAPHGAAAGAAACGSFTGCVVETMNASRYTYVLAESGTNRVWAAAPQFSVRAGDTVVVPLEMPMKGFRSASLGREFDTLYMAPRIEVGGPPPAGSR
jgi:hypothetical protein